MAQIKKIKFNNIDYNLTARNGIFYIQGTGIIDDINNTSIWTGIHPDIVEYFEGLTIAYKIGIEGSITTVLNINDLGNILVVKNTSEKISTDYSVGSVILLTYTIDDGVAYWKISDYNEDTKNTVGNYLQNDTQLYLIGTINSDASLPSSSANSYTNNNCYIGEDNCLYSNDKKVSTEEYVNEKVADIITKDQVETLYKRLNSNTALGFYCIEDVTIVINGESTIYPANSNVEIKLIETDVFEIIPTSDNSILSLTAFPRALGTYYSWLEGVKQFSNILFDMNNEDFYSKWSQGNQGAYQVQFAQYINCIFWSDNAYVSDVNKRTNYTLYNTAQLPLCYSSIPDNTFKAFYLAFGANSDPNWGNQTYRDSFAKATWATQVFSYYGARTIGVFGHDDPDFNIVLPKDCRGLMYQSTAIENAGTFDAINTTNFGAKSGSWREAFGQCSSLRNLYIKNLKVNLNISWSPINYNSINFIISTAANTNAITISVSPYTYNLLGPSDFELAASKNITIALLTTNYVEDKRLSEVANKADKAYVDERVANLVNSAPETLDTIGELAIAIQENKEVIDVLNEAIVTKANKTYVDELIANIPTESDIVIVDCPDGSIISHTFEQIMTAKNENKVVYAFVYGTNIMPLTYISEDNSFVEFSTIRGEITDGQYTTVWVDGLVVNNDNSFVIKHGDLLGSISISEDELDNLALMLI